MVMRRDYEAGSEMTKVGRGGQEGPWMCDDVVETREVQIARLGICHGARNEHEHVPRHWGPRKRCRRSHRSRY
jgi:hypothetical protein